MDDTISQEHVNFIIAEAQRKQLAKPARAVVNSECAFVANRLRTEGYFETAAAYWAWSCGSATAIGNNFSQEVKDLQQQLRAIDAGQTMPYWGTHGT